MFDHSRRTLTIASLATPDERFPAAVPFWPSSYTSKDRADERSAKRSRSAKR